MKRTNWSVRRVAVVVSAAAMAMMLWSSAALAADGAEAYQALQDRIEKVADDLGRSVVSIQTKSKVSQQPLDWDSDLWDMLPDQWRRRLPQPRRQAPRQDDGELVPQGIGSGVIISADGYILTNQHVVREAAEVEVVLSDKRRFKATVVGQDPRSDLAVLKVEATELPAATLNGAGCLFWRWGRRSDSAPTGRRASVSALSAARAGGWPWAWRTRTGSTAS